MADTTPQKRVLPARERRESAAKRRASSPPPLPKPAPTPSKTISVQPASEPRVKRKYTKRASLLNNAESGRRNSTPVSTAGEPIPTKLNSTKPLPTSRTKQTDNLSKRDYQSISESAILAASLHRSRMQWLCDGIFQKYWTKPMKRKGVEAPTNNPDIKSMHKLGTGTIVIEPHSFDVTFYTVKDLSIPEQPYYRHPNQHTVKHTQQQTPQPTHGTPVFNQIPRPSPLSQTSPGTTTPVVKTETSTAQPLTAPQHQSPAVSSRPRTPPGGAKTTDPVIQMLAARAATDNHLKELMKVVATSRASPDQLREFQAHIDEFNAIVKRQEAERERQAKERAAAQATPRASNPPTSNAGPSRGPLPTTNTPGGYSSYQTPPPRPEPVIKHIVMEFTSSALSQQLASSDRWLFPEHAVLDMRYNATEMTCSFFVERKGSDILSLSKGASEDSSDTPSQVWDASKEYFQPVTMTVKASQAKTIEMIARSAKSLGDVQEYMKEVMEKKTRAPQEFLVHQLPRDKPDLSMPDFVDSGVELSAEEDDELKGFYGMPS